MSNFSYGDNTFTISSLIYSLFFSSFMTLLGNICGNSHFFMYIFLSGLIKFLLLILAVFANAGDFDSGNELG